VKGNPPKSVEYKAKVRRYDLPLLRRLSFFF
jgi:hypothetical protein